MKRVRVYVAASLRCWNVSPGMDNLLKWKLMKAGGLDVQISLICAHDAENCSYTTGRIAFCLGSSRAVLGSKNHLSSIIATSRYIFQCIQPAHHIAPVHLDESAAARQDNCVSVILACCLSG